MNRRLEILIGAILVLALIVFIGINVFNMLLDQDKVIGKISDAILNLDIDYLKDHIEIEGVKGPLTSEQISNIATILKENGYNNGYSLKNSYGAFNENIYLKKQGKENILLDKYILVLKSYNITIESDIPNSMVYLDGIEAGTIDEDTKSLELKGIIPGKHNIKVIHQGEYATLENQKELICFDRYDNSIYHHIPLEGHYVEIVTNYAEAKLYINDKETDIELDHYYILGPVSTDGTIEIQAKVEIDGEIYCSEKFPIDGSYGVYDLYIDYVEPPAIEEPTVMVTTASSGNITEAINNLMYQYQYNMVEAINYGDYNIVSSYIENNSPLMSAQVGLVDRLASKGTKEELLGYEIENINKISDTIFEVQVFEEHRILYSSGSEETVSNRYIYTVVLIDDKVYLRDIRR